MKINDTRVFLLNKMLTLLPPKK